MRSLVAAGVDALSLRGRLAELSEIDLAKMRETYRGQWLLVSRRLREARACEAVLTAKVYADEVEDELVASIPATRKWVEEVGGEPTGPFEPAVASLRLVLDQSPHWRTRTLAAVALLRLGELSHEVVARARRALNDGAPLRYEAALALGSWRVRSRFMLDRWQRRYWVEALDDALKDPAFRPAAAAVRANVTGSLDESRRAEVEALLHGDDPDLRLEAALALGAEAPLLAELDAEPATAKPADAERRRVALRALARVSPERVLPELERVDEAGRRELLRWLEGPITAPLLDALLAHAVRDEARFRREALEKVAGERWEELEPGVRHRFATWLEEHAALVPLEQVLRLCEWAALPTEQPRSFPLPRDGEDVRAVLAATTHALRDADGPGRLEGMGSRGFLTWLACAREPERDVLAGWLHAPEEGRALLEALLQLQAHLNSYGDAPDQRAAALLEALWARSDADRQHLVPLLAKVTGRHGGMSGRDALLARFWGRFVLRPTERRAIAAALEPWRRELHELERADPIAPGVEDPRLRFRVWADAEPAHLVEHTERLLTQARTEWLAELAREVFERARQLAATEPIQAVLAAFRMAVRIASLAREEGGERAEVQAAVAVLRQQVPLLRRALEETTASDEETRARARRLAQEDFDVELRLIDEADEARAEQARREAARQAEKERRRREQAERERALAAAQADQRAQLEELERKRRAFLEGPKAEVSGASRVRFRPVLPAVPLDEEALGAAPLRTVVDYAECLKALSAGGDVLVTLAQRGLDPTSWAQVAQAWSQVMGSRQDVALRFGALLQAEWTASPPSPSGRGPG